MKVVHPSLTTLANNLPSQMKWSRESDNDEKTLKSFSSRAAACPSSARKKFMHSYPRRDCLFRFSFATVVVRISSWGGDWEGIVRPEGLGVFLLYSRIAYVVIGMAEGEGDTAGGVG
jgi:hypothetical protein